MRKIPFLVAGKMEKLEWFARWHGGSLFVCLLLLSIFGGGRGPWIVVISSLAGIPIAIWLTRADEKGKLLYKAEKLW
jgi:hypothetical protein